MVNNYKWVFSYKNIKIYSIAEEHPIPHRLDGPAIIYINGTQRWAYMGEIIDCSSQKEFEKLLELKVFW